MAIISGDYVSLNDAKDHLNLKDDLDDTKVADILEEANHEIDVALIPVADKLPITDDKLFEFAKHTGLIYVESRWAKKKNQFEKAKELKEEFEGKLKRLIAAIRALPTENKRTQPATASCSYSSELLRSINGITDNNQRLYS